MGASMMRERPIYLMICLAALLPAAFVLVGHPGDDVVFHTSSWVEMLEGWRSGVVWPAWAAHANFNLGEPRFYFYPPLSRVIGAALLAMVPVRLVPAVFVWAMLALAGFGTLRLSAGFLPAEDRPIAALLGITSYYLNVLALVRFAMAELMAAALLPLVLLAYLNMLARWRERNSVRTDSRDMALLAVLLAAIWISDAPAAVALAYVLTFTTAIEAMWQRSFRPLLTLLAAEATGLALSAWYLLPALLARYQISSDALLSNNLRGLMLFHAPVRDFSAAMRYPLWIWMILGVAIAVLAAQREPLPVKTFTSDPKPALRLPAIMALIVLLCQLPVSLLLWRYLPQFRFIQIPFRFDAILGALLPIAALHLLRSRPSRRFLYAVWVLFFLVPLTIQVVQQICQPGWPKVAVIAGRVSQGYAGYAEYNTVGVAKRVTDTMPLVTPLGSTLHECTDVVEIWTPELRQVASTSGQACSYQLALTYYPDWHLWIDGASAKLLPGLDGTTEIFVPPGRHRLVLKFVRPREPAIAGVAVSCVAFCLLVVLLRAGRRRLLFVSDHGTVG
jgi:hypothetical protein